MTFQTLKEFIDSHPSCRLCGSGLIPYVRSDNISPAPTKLKYFRNINCKLTNNSFVFKIDYITSSIELHDQVLVSIENNFINCRKQISEVAEVFNTLSLRLEKVCPCDNYFLMSDYLISSPEGFIHTIKLDAEIVVINKTLTAITYPYTQNTFIYNSDNEKSYPVSIPKIEFSPEDKEKQFNRIQTIVNFS